MEEYRGLTFDELHPMVTPDMQETRDRAAEELRTQYESDPASEYANPKVKEHDAADFGQKGSSFKPMLYTGEVIPPSPQQSRTPEPYTGDVIPPDQSAPQPYSGEVIPPESIAVGTDYRGDKALPQEDYGDQVSRGVQNKRLAYVPDAVDKLWSGTQATLDPWALSEVGTNALSKWFAGIPLGLGGALAEAGTGLGKLTAGADASDTFSNMGKRFAELQDAVTYEPRSPGGKLLASAIGEFTNAVMQGTHTYVGEPLASWAEKHQGQYVNFGGVTFEVPDPVALGVISSTATQVAETVAGFKAFGAMMPPGAPHVEVTPSIEWKIFHSLVDPTVDPVQRYGAVLSVAERLRAEGRVGDPAISAWMDNAAQRISEGRTIDMSNNAFSSARSTDIEGSVEQGAPEGTPQREAPPPESVAQDQQRALPAPQDVAMQVPREPSVPDNTESTQNTPDLLDNSARLERNRVQQDALNQAAGLPPADGPSGAIETRTAASIPIDADNPMASIAAIAAAPVTPVSAVSHPNVEAHQAAAGDLAGIMLELYRTQKLAAVTAPKFRAPLTDRITELKAEAQSLLADHQNTYGPDARTQVHLTAAQTFHALKGDYNGLRSPAAQQATTLFNQHTAVESAKEREKFAAEEQKAKAQYVKQGEQAATAAEPAKEETSTAEPAFRASSTEPVQATPAQLAANNAAHHGEVVVEGLPVSSIEVSSGKMRQDKKNIPPKWQSPAVGVNIGYFRTGNGVSSQAVIGADGLKTDHPDNHPAKSRVDVMWKDGTPTDFPGPFFVVDQIDPKTGRFDEHKVLGGFDTKEAAISAYNAQYPAGWKGLGDISATSKHGLKTWLRFGDKSVPYSGYQHPESPRYANRTVRRTVMLTDGSEATIHMKSEDAIRIAEERVAAVKDLLECL